MALSPKAPLKDRVADHCATCGTKIERSSLRNRDVQAMLRTTRRLHIEVQQAFFKTKHDISQDLGYYHRMLVKLDELTLDLLSRATTFPAELTS